MYVEYEPEELEQMYEHYQKQRYAGASFLKRTGLPEITSSMLEKNGIGKQIQSDLVFDGVLQVISIRNDITTYQIDGTTLNSYMAELQQERGKYIDGQQTLGVA